MIWGEGKATFEFKCGIVDLYSDQVPVCCSSLLTSQERPATGIAIINPKITCFFIPVNEI